jgi:hypothetical protein
MEMIFINEEAFIKDIHDKNKMLFDKYFENSSLINDAYIVWSDSYLDFSPYQSEMNQTVSTKIYKKEPKNNIGKVLNKYNKRNELFYSCKYKQENFGTIFYQNNEKEKHKLLYTQNKGLWNLDQIDYLKLENGKIIKRIFYLANYRGKDTFYSDEYFYDTSGKINEVKRNGYHYGNSNISPERTFRFEYNGEVLIKIFSRMLKTNGDDKENEIYTNLKK